MKPRIFIGSSTEGLPIAQYIKSYFQADYDCTIWNEDVFKFNSSFIDTLIKSASLFDFAFMVFSKDDLLQSRDTVFDSARDNVLFEYGLFLGRVGINRAFIIQERGIKLPSDLLGVTIATYEVDADKKNTDSLNDVLGKLKLQMEEKFQLGELGLLPSTVIAISYFENFVKLVADTIYTSEKSPFDSQQQYTSIKLRIVVPNDLDSEIKKKANVYFRENGLTPESIRTNLRSYPIHVQIFPDSGQLVIVDMPTTLVGVDKAIDMYFRGRFVGKTTEQKQTEDRELNNFVHVLKLLISQDSYCRKCVEIVDENNSIL